jgi:hypothetical protein
VRGFSSTPSSREEFSPDELATAMRDFAEYGPQFYLSDGDLGMAVYRFGENGERVLFVAEKRGLLTTLTLREVGIQASAVYLKSAQTGVSFRGAPAPDYEEDG